MPLVPLVRVKDFDAALETALFIEQDLRHTAVIHSRSIDHLNRAAHIMQTSLFVKNGPSLVGLGLGGENSTSFTVANVTGEGVTTARHFARRRRCTLTSGFSIR
jgi:propionaldehyde dehydrogenase